MHPISTLHCRCRHNIILVIVDCHDSSIGVIIMRIKQLIGNYGKRDEARRQKKYGVPDDIATTTGRQSQKWKVDQIQQLLACQLKDFFLNHNFENV